MTSQSDVKITKQLFKTKPKCISEWYGINIDYEHEKLFPIPLGIANNYSPKNLTYSNFLAKEKVSPKLKKIYCNYNPNTNNYERKKISRINFYQMIYYFLMSQIYLSSSIPLD